MNWWVDESVIACATERVSLLSVHAQSEQMAGVYKGGGRVPVVVATNPPLPGEIKSETSCLYP